LGSWEIENFRTKCCAMGQSDGLSHSFTSYCGFIFIALFHQNRISVVLSVIRYCQS